MTRIEIEETLELSVFSRHVTLVGNRNGTKLIHGVFSGKLLQIII